MTNQGWVCRPWEPKARPDRGAVRPLAAAAAAAVLRRPCLARTAATRLPPARLVCFSAMSRWGSAEPCLIAILLMCHRASCCSVACRC